MKNIVRLTSFALAAVLGVVSAGGMGSKAFASTTVNSSNNTTGPSSSNTNTTSVSNSSNFVVNNNGSTTTNVNFNANTGNNTVTNNTTVNGVSTGGVNFNLQSTNSVNNANINVPAGFGSSGTTTVNSSSSLTGPNSLNSNSVSLANSNNVQITQNATATNNVNLTANTGGNTIDGNTSVAGFSTGAIAAAISINNALNGGSIGPWISSPDAPGMGGDEIVPASAAPAATEAKKEFFPTGNSTSPLAPLFALAGLFAASLLLDQQRRKNSPILGLFGAGSTNLSYGRPTLTEQHSSQSSPSIKRSHNHRIKSK